jgi:DHA2 family multidrug resistance protein
MRALQGYLGHQTAPANAAHAAQGVIYQQLGSQALLWAFVDFFRYLAVLCAFSIGLVWCFKKVAKKKAPVAAH